AKDAMKYATALAEIRFSDVERRETTLTEISSALSDATTSFLMTSPLQVTILFGIATLKGDIPRDRWELFDKYYTLLREREAEKPGGIGRILRTHKRQIDAIHHEAGFLLQVAAESAGAANSYLPEHQFTLMIKRLLVSEGFSEQKAETVTQEIVHIATQ